MSATAAGDAALGELHGSFGGEIAMPGDPSYDERRRVWNGSIDRFPALIARSRGVVDMIAAVELARDAGLPAAVRGGGPGDIGQARHPLPKSEPLPRNNRRRLAITTG